jgi:hypothetical protein
MSSLEQQKGKQIIGFCLDHGGSRPDVCEACKWHGKEITETLPTTPEQHKVEGLQSLLAEFDEKFPWDEYHEGNPDGEGSHPIGTTWTQPHAPEPHELIDFIAHAYNQGREEGLGEIGKDVEEISKFIGRPEEVKYRLGWRDALRSVYAALSSLKEQSK